MRSAILNSLSSLFAPRVIVDQPARIPDREVTRILAGTHDKHPVYLAFMQLLDQAIEEAADNACEDFNVPRGLEVHTGGGKYLRALRDQIHLRRSQPLKGRNAETIRED
jgi:hypothetical protein